MTATETVKLLKGLSKHTAYLVIATAIESAYFWLEITDNVVERTLRG